MSRETLIALRATIVTLVLTGLVYPLVMTGLAQVIFPWPTAAWPATTIRWSGRR